jgi:hypothetical protein
MEGRKKVTLSCHFIKSQRNKHCPLLFFRTQMHKCISLSLSLSFSLSKQQGQAGLRYENALETRIASNMVQHMAELGQQQIKKVAVVGQSGTNKGLGGSGWRAVHDWQHYFCHMPF